MAFTIESLLSPDHALWARRNLVPMDSKYKMALSSNHWIISGSTDPEACRAKLARLLAIRAQTSTWTLELRKKQEKCNGRVPVELITERDYYILARNYDPTWRYSDSIHALNHGEEQEEYLNNIVRHLPKLKELKLSQSHVFPALGGSDEFDDIITEYHPDLDGLDNYSLYYTSFKDKAAYKSMRNMSAKLHEYHRIASGWSSPKVTIWNRHAPPKSTGLTVPNSWLTSIADMGMLLDAIFDVEYNRHLLSAMLHAKYYDQLSIHIKPISSAPNERRVLVSFGDIEFYHTFNFFMNGVPYVREYQEGTT